MLNRNNTQGERGAAAVELALVVSILVLLVFGIIEFGRAFNAQVSLTAAAREGVRYYAIEKDAAGAATITRNAATSLDPGSISVATAACTPGQPTQLTATYPFTIDIPFFGTRNLTLSAIGVMRCGG